jgi:hypothetical protein
VLRGKLLGWGSPPDKSDDIQFQADLELELKNTGTKPVLVLKPECTGYGDYVLGSVRLLTAPNAEEENNVLTEWAAWYSRDGSEKWQTMREEMDQATSPEEHFWLIEPGASRAFRSYALLRFDDIQIIGKRTPREVWPEVPKQKQLWIAVQIQIWPGNLETLSGGADNSEFGRKLRDRWSKVGTIELGKDGLLESEPIPIQFPTVH